MKLLISRHLMLERIKLSYTPTLISMPHLPPPVVRLVGVVVYVIFDMEMSKGTSRKPASRYRWQYLILNVT